MLFNSQKDVVSGKFLAFSNILGFRGINWAQIWTKTFDQNLRLQVRPVSAQTLNFERLFKFYLCLMRDYLWLKLQQTCAIFREERAQKQ